MSEFSKELDVEQKRIKGENIRINYSDKKFYECFFNEYHFAENSAQRLSRDAEFVYVQHKKKLRAMEIEMAESVSPMPLSEVSGSSFSDEKYVRKRLTQPFYRRVKFRKKSGKSFERRQSIFTDANVIYPRANSIADNEKFPCPNCGKTAGLKQLEQGCEACGEETYITGLFPKVKGFFYRKNNSISIRDIGKTLLVCCIIGMIMGIPFGISEFIKNVSGRFTQNTFSDAVASAFTAPLEWIMIGVVAAVLVLLVRLIYDNIKNTSLIFETNEAKKKIVQTVTEQEKTFCFDDFEAKVISLLKLVIFTNEDEREQLVCCQLKNPVRKFEIADCLYMGYMKLADIHTDYNLCSISLDIYTEDICVKEKKFYVKNNVFRITVEKRLSEMNDTGFELCNSTCPLCYEHFNSLENPHCTFCDAEYNPIENDWVVTDVKMK
ncbi:MAG: hypothetical protein IJA12_03185 [Oscillospiraceae bacterium]|nr:hypothetical protein [Oscillospiraceae bacterium]